MNGSFCFCAFTALSLHPVSNSRRADYLILPLDCSLNFYAVARKILARLFTVSAFVKDQIPGQRIVFCKFLCLIILTVKHFRFLVYELLKNCFCALSKCYLYLSISNTSLSFILMPFSITQCSPAFKAAAPTCLFSELGK